MKKDLFGTKNKKRKLKGFSLAELILAIGIFSASSAMLVFLVIDSTRTIENVHTRDKATRLTEDIFNSLLILKKTSWYNIALYTGEGEKHLEYIDGEYIVQDGPITEGGVTYYFTVNNVLRDSNHNIVKNGGTVDPHSRLISVHIEWVDRLGQPKTNIQELFMNDWNTKTVIYTTREDFTSGTHDQTVAVELSDGELRLQKRFYSDWCRPELSLNKDESEYDIPGNATPRSVFAQLGSAYLGTRGEKTGEPFTKLIIEGVDPPIVTVEGYFSGYDVNDIFITGNYAFLATTDNGKEVVILNISSYPYTEVGYFNAPGNDDALTVFVDGKVGYVGQGKNVHSFNLDKYTGSRALLGTIATATRPSYPNSKPTVSRLRVLNGYLYAVLDMDWDELAILNVSNPKKMTTVSKTSVNNQQVYDMEISDDGTRAYFGTTHSSSEHEFFILNTSNKSSVKTIASVNTPSTTIYGISIVQEGNKKFAIIVGTGGQEYQVWNITNEKSITKCGGMEVNSGVYDIGSIRDSYTNAFSYIITGDTSKEFKIIRGGPGGGGEDGYAFYDQGTYLSLPYDSESTTAEYYVLGIKTDIPPSTTIRIQVRASNNSNMSGSVWIGPDGTSSTYYDVTGVHILPMGIVGRYFQYKVEYTSTNIDNSALLEEVVINYEK